MAQYAPQAYVLSDEQEYLQAYEDVLEKYKGRINADWLIFRLRDDEILKILPLLLLDSSINVSLPPLSLVTGWS